MQYESESGDILLALTGETLISRALKPFREPEFLELRDLLHSADVRFTNAEVLFHNYEDSPAYRPGGTYMRCDPRYIEDLLWLGINMVCTANNHSYDFGEAGVLTNRRYLDQYGMVHAGTGTNMSEASAPVYMDTPKGRVALIAATTFGMLSSRAAEQRRDFKGRPGCNLIRSEPYWVVDHETFDALRLVASKLGWSDKTPGQGSEGFWTGQADQVLFFDRGRYGGELPFARFVLGEACERHFALDESDLERNVRSVRDAARMADWVLFTFHTNEGGKTHAEPSDHAIALAHAVIDAGAHMVIGHGSHQDRGMELYKKRPIFYSLGDFMLQNDTVEKMPQDNMVRWKLGWDSTPADFYDARSKNETGGMMMERFRWESVVPFLRFSGKELAEIKLYAVDLGFRRPRSQRGRPVLASGDVARSALERFKKRSEPLGTDIQINGDTANVILAQAAAGIR